MKLEELLGEELYSLVKEKIDTANANEPDKLKHIRYADLSEGEYVSKGKYEGLIAEKENLSGQIETLNTTINTLQKDNEGNEALQNSITSLQGELKKQQEENQKITKTYALKEQLSKQGVLDPDYLIYKAGGIEKFAFDKENHPVGLEDAVKPYREDAAMGYLFKQEPKTPPYQPNNGNTGGFSNPFAKDTFNLTAQGRLLKENPAQAKELAAAAGVNI